MELLPVLPFLGSYSPKNGYFAPRSLFHCKRMQKSGFVPTGFHDFAVYSIIHKEFPSKTVEWFTNDSLMETVGRKYQVALVYSALVG